MAAAIVLRLSSDGGNLAGRVGAGHSATPFSPGTARRSGTQAKPAVVSQQTAAPSPSRRRRGYSGRFRCLRLHRSARRRERDHHGADCFCDPHQRMGQSRGDDPRRSGGGRQKCLPRGHARARTDVPAPGRDGGRHSDDPAARHGADLAAAAAPRLAVFRLHLDGRDKLDPGRDGDGLPACRRFRGAGLHVPPAGTLGEAVFDHVAVSRAVAQTPVPPLR